MVAGKGDLGRALFAAGGGRLASVGGVQRELEKVAEELFLPRGSKPTINADLARLDDLRKQIKAATLPSSEWVEHDRALREAQAREAAARRRAARGRPRAQPAQAVADAVAPPRGAGSPRRAGAPGRSAEDLRGFHVRYRERSRGDPETEQAEAEAWQRVAELTDQLEALDVPGALLDQAEAIEGLHQRLGGLIQAASDRRNREAELARLETEARAALRDLGATRMRRPQAPGKTTALSPRSASPPPTGPSCST